MGGIVHFGLENEPVGAAKHVVSLRGEVDAHTAPKLGSCLFGLAEEGKTGVVVDLSDVTFLDSTGIGVLVNALRHFSLRRARLVLVCPTERILRPFQIAGLAERLTIFDSREKALAGLATA
jgi:anti-sigma B factor antagonist